MTKPERHPVQPSNLFCCVECNETFDVTKTFDLFKTHLKEKHNITKLKGTRRARAHLDGDNWFAWEYDWLIDGKPFTQTVTCPRSRKDQVYWYENMD